MDLELRTKRALVTGGSRGIGKAIARGLALEGASVALLARDAERLAASRRGARATRPARRVVAVVADTSDEAQVERAVAEAVAALGGGIDILVNAAAEPGGYAAPPALAEIDAAHLQREIDVKVMGYLRCARAVAPHMKAQRWGRIVNLSGLAARQTGNTVGSIRNVAVAALTKNLADELGPDGINVTVVHPGLTRTERTAALRRRRAPQAQGIERGGDREADGRRQLDPPPRRRARGRRRRRLPLLAEVGRDQRRRHRRRRRRAARHPLLSGAAVAHAHGAAASITPRDGRRRAAAVHSRGRRRSPLRATTHPLP